MIKDEMNRVPLERQAKDVFSDLCDNTLEVQPDFQRFYVWKDSQVSKLIESILRGFPIPEMFLW